MPHRLRTTGLVELVRSRLSERDSQKSKVERDWGKCSVSSSACCMCKHTCIYIHVHTSVHTNSGPWKGREELILHDTSEGAEDTWLALTGELNTIQFESGHSITCVYVCGVYMCKCVLVRGRRSEGDFG